MMGNWNCFRSDGNGTWDLEQQRTANPVNEITGIIPPSTPPGYSPSYDRAGNLSRIPSTTPAAGLNWQTLTVDEWDTLSVDEWDTLGVDPFEIGQTFTYDAWNRLVSVSDDGDLIQTNTYDGAGFRVIRETTASAAPR